MFAELSMQGIWEQIKVILSGSWDYVSDPWVIVGMVIVVILITLFFYLRKRQPSKIRAFNNSNGYVEISRSALIDIIRATSEQVDIEKKPGVFVKVKRGKLHIDVRIRLLPTRRLTEVSEILQKHLIETLQEGMGIRKLGNINVVVVGVRIKTGKDSRKSLPLYSKPEIPSNDSESVELMDDLSSDEPPKIDEGVEDRVDSSEEIVEHDKDLNERDDSKA